VESDAEKRPNLKEIKEFVWYSKCTYSDKELAVKMREKINETLDFYSE